MSNLEKAKEHQKKADAAYSTRDYANASEHCLKAAELYDLGRDLPWANFLKGRVWYFKALAMEPKSIEEYRKIIECYNKAIYPTNVGIDLMDADHPNYNMASESLRLYETRRFADLSAVEVMRAEESSKDAEENADHLQRAALFRRSVAFAMEIAAELSRESGSELMYNYQMAGHHYERAHYHHLLARSYRTLKYLKGTLDETERSREECEKAVKFYKKSLNQRPSERREAELEIAKSFLVKRLGEIGDLRSIIKHRKNEGKEIPDTGEPKLDIRVIPLRGMVKNLITTMAVKLTNSGTARASNIRIEIDSDDMEGDTSARLERLLPGRNARAGLSLIPINAGDLPIRFTVKYKGPKGRRFKSVKKTRVIVGQPRDKRHESKVIMKIRGDDFQVIDTEQ